MHGVRCYGKPVWNQHLSVHVLFVMCILVVARYDKCETNQRESNTNRRTSEAEYQGKNGWKAPSRRDYIYYRVLESKEKGGKSRGLQ